eukprot:5803537-Pyramimonas_sp.AAC.1
MGKVGGDKKDERLYFVVKHVREAFKRGCFYGRVAESGARVSKFQEGKKRRRGCACWALSARV